MRQARSALAYGRKLPLDVSGVIGVNVRTLRRRKGWSQSQLGELMGWSPPIVCEAEGRRTERGSSPPQRLFREREVEHLAGIFGVTVEELKVACLNCGGNPCPGFRCLACGAENEL